MFTYPNSDAFLLFCLLTEQILLVPNLFFLPASWKTTSPRIYKQSFHPDRDFILIGQRKEDGSLTDKGLFEDLLHNFCYVLENNTQERGGGEYCLLTYVQFYFFFRVIL